jgi:starch-binding outer membrane protein, SusD/RagB family
MLPCNNTQNANIKMESMNNTIYQLDRNCRQDQNNPFPQESAECEFLSRHINQQFLLVVVAALCLCSCKKLIEIDPPINNITAANVYTTDLTAANVLTGLYIKMSRENAEFRKEGFIATLFQAGGLSADELTLFNSEYSESNFNLFFKNELTALQSPSYWGNIYADLFVANSAIEGISKSTTRSSAIKEQLLGEAKFMRAFYLFYLVNLYGDVPLVTTTDYKINSQLPRASKAAVYQQIISDLQDSQSLLTEEYKGGDALSIATERVRPNKFAATALLARAFLYQASETNDTWAQAEEEASKVIASSQYDTIALSEVFLNTSKEVIWQLQPVRGGVDGNSGEGKFFVLPAEEDFSYPAFLNNALVSSFEMNDRRKSEWVGIVNYNGTVYAYPNKYKIAQGVDEPSIEYSTIFRLAEQYLIRAEARTYLGDVAGAQADINVIRKRAGLPNTSAFDEASLLAAIAQERKVELFTEGGHRWFDLKRTGQADAVLGPIKGSTWQTTDQLYPIPSREIAKSPSLQGQQNPGYQ